MKANASTPRANASPSSLEVSEIPRGAAAERIERVELREQLRRVVDPLVIVPRAFAEPLGSVQLDYTITPPATLAVSAADAEREARARMGAAAWVTTCSVRLARYDNLSEHLAAVWVVQLDGLSMEALGGDLFASPPRSPHILRRAIVLITTDAPAKPVLSIATGP